MKSKKPLSRREFLKYSAQVAAILGYYGSGKAHADQLMNQLVPGEGSDPNTTPFDFIVVGSGAGGGPLASNLARNGFKVLLLEAGGDYHGDHYKIPIFHALSTETPEMAWNFYVKHYRDDEKNMRDSKYDCEKNGVLYPRAATLGGCTAHNAMITLYPHNSDWNHIAKLTQDSSWTAERMRKYFERVENATYLKDKEARKERRGKFGWLSTELDSLKLLLKDTQLIDIVIATLRASGAGDDTIARFLVESSDLDLDPNAWKYVNSVLTTGLFRIPKATKNGVRNGPREYILETLKQYPEYLTLRTGSLATQLLFSEKDSSKVIGVEYLAKDKAYRADPQPSFVLNQNALKKKVYAKHEVILAGGAFNTPQLLMLSGIGDPAELSRHQIKTRVDLPGVGKNLQDRYEINVTMKLPKKLELIENCTFGGKNDPCMEEYKQDPKNSVYASNGVVISVIEKSHPSKATPDLCLFGLPGSFRGYYRGWSKDVFKKDHFTWAILKGHTNNNAGAVTLKSSNPLDMPEINFNYFEDGNDHRGRDLDGIVAGVKIARKISEKFPKGSHEVFPGKKFNTDELLREHVKQEAWGHHASCSCKMGIADDPMAVVDSKFQVYKTKGLRIVDASVFPKIPGLFIVAPIYMISEKASEVITKHYS